MVCFGKQNTYVDYFPDLERSTIGFYQHYAPKIEVSTVNGWDKVSRDEENEFISSLQ